ncbi:MAG: glycosyltransferase family A protein [Bacteroidota bacterium]
MQQPLVSVILPFYNAEATLHRAIESIVKQTFPNWELILVDNQSTDSSYLIAQHFANKDNRIQIIDEPKSGVTFAFNAGLNHARGKYVARMDADDYSHPQRLEQQIYYLENHLGIDAVSGLVNYQADIPQAGMQHYVDWTNTLVSSEQIADNRFVELPTINPTLMFRQDSLEKCGSYQSGDFPEDYELVLRWLEQGAIIGKVDTTVLDWYDHPNRLTRADSRYSTEAFYRIKTKYLVEWLQQNNPFHPEVVVWGGGRKARQRAKLLEDYRVTIDAYIDVVPDKTAEKPCIYFKDIGSPGQYFILSYVGNRGRKEEIRQFLVNRGYRETIHFLLVA